MRVLSALIFVSTLFAQETLNHATVSGRVTDPAGAVVEGAAVLARQVDTNLKSVATTDREGRYRFPYLAVGPYEIVATKTGFAPSKRTVTLMVGSTFDVPLALALATEGASVTVSAEGAVVEVARTQIAGTVSTVEVNALPLNGRNFLD